MKETMMPHSDTIRDSSAPPIPKRIVSFDSKTEPFFTEEKRREKNDAIRDWIEAYLENHFPKYDTDTEHDFISYCQKCRIGHAPESDQAQDVAPRRQDPRVEIGSDATEAFLHGIIGVMRKHANDSEKLQRFQESLSENARFDRWGFRELDDAAFVSVYTDYERSSGLSESDTPFAVMRTYFADRLANMNDADLRTLLEGLSKRPPGERMDIVQFLPVPTTLDEDYFEPSSGIREAHRERFRFVLEHLGDTDVAAIRFSALHRITERETYWRKCDAAGGEVFLEYEETPFEERTNFQKRVVTDKTLPHYYSAGRIATDAIAFFDGSDVPRYVSRVSSERLDQLQNETEATDWHAIADLRRELRDTPVESSDGLYFVISTIEEALFSKGTRRDPAFLARIYSEMSNVLDESSWKDFFQQVSELDRLFEEDWQQTETLEENPQTNRDAIRDRILNVTNDHQAERSDASENSGIQHDLLHTLLDQDRTAVDEHLGLIFQSRERNRKQEEETKRRIDAILDGLLTHGETFRQDVLSFLDEELRRAKESGELIETDLVPYDEFVRDPSLDPFENIDPETRKIIQNLHSSAAKDFLGMDFSRLPLRAQIHFLSFRGKEKTSAAERFRLAIEKHKAVADDLAYSFLATAEGSEYGETILSLAESLDTETLGPILKKYAEITRDADAVADYIRESFPNIGKEEAEREALAISKNLLRRGRDLLVEFSKNADADPETILRKLDDVSAGVELYKKTFRSLRDAGALRDLTEMAETEIDVLSPADLSERDKEWMRDLYRRSYPESSYSKTHRETLFSKLEKRLSDREHDTRFYILRGAGENAGFIVFEDGEPTKDGRPTRYGSSFNSEKKFRADAMDSVTSAFADSMLLEEGSDTIIELDSDPMNRVSDFYLKRYGFVGIHTEMIGDAERIRMRRYPDVAERPLSARVGTTAEAADEAIRNGHPFGYVEHVRLDDRTNLIATVREMTKKGYVLTAIAPERKNSGVVAVFENRRMLLMKRDARKERSISSAAA